MASIYRRLTDSARIKDICENTRPIDKLILTEEDFTAVENIKNEHVFGQDHIIEQVTKKMRANYEIPGRKTPILSCLVIGSPGVGKTSLAEQINLALFKHPQYLLRIDSQQYNAHDSASLFGTAKGYVGSDKPGAIPAFLGNGKGAGVILIDEPERVQGDATQWVQSHMPLLDGRVTEVSTKVEYSTANCILIFASNFGHQELGTIANKYKQSKDLLHPSELEAKMRKEFVRFLEKSCFPTAFLDRLDFIGVFSPLNGDIMVDIVLKAISMLADKHNMGIDFIDPSVWQTAIQVGQAADNPGARVLESWVKEHVNPALTYAKRQGAKKVRIILGTNDQIYAQIVESQSDSPASTASKTKAKS